MFTATVAFSLLDPVELSLHPIDSVVDVEIPIECSAPEVIGFSPADAAVDVAAGSVIRVTFSKAVAAGTVTADTFTVDNGGPVAGTVTVAGNRKSATFNPDVDLQYQTAYTVTATAGIQDKAGNPLVPDSATFTTIEPDTTSPEVVNVTPADGALDLPVGGDVTVTFSEPIEPATLNSGSFGLVNGGAVPGSVVAATDALSATFTPDGPLAYETPYQVSVTGDVTDTSGNALAPFASSFTTGRAPLDPGIPVFESYRVDDGPSHDGTGNDSRGNNDGLAQCGETIELYATVRNGGGLPLLSLSALLIESDPYVTMLYNNSASFPALDAGFTAENPRDWDLLISPDAPGGHQFAFILRFIAAGGGPWDVDVTVPVGCTELPDPGNPGVPVYVSYRVDDGPGHDGTGNDSKGNDDGVAQCGETIELYVTLVNGGDVALTGVSALLIESDPYVSLLYNASASYPDIGPGTPRENPRDWDLLISPDAPGGHQFAFILRFIAAGGGPWDVDVTVPVGCTELPDPGNPGVPVYVSYRVDDGPGHDGTGNDSKGNDDGVAQCGETIELYVTLVNGGDVALTGVSALLIESDPYVSLLYNASASYPDIGPGTPRENPRDWDLLISPDAPGGHQFAFILRVGADGGGWWDIDVTVPVDCGDPPAPEDPGLPVLVGVRVDDGPAHDGTGNDSEGNDDGVAQCGETIEVYVRIGNAGAVTLTGVSGLLLESDPHATLLYNTSAAYPDLAGVGGAENPRDWDLRLAEGTPDGHQLAFTVRVTDDGGGSWDIDVVVPIACP